MLIKQISATLRSVRNFKKREQKMRQQILTGLGKNPLIKVLSPPSEIKNIVGNKALTLQRLYATID